MTRPKGDDVTVTLRMRHANFERMTNGGVIVGIERGLPILHGLELLADGTYALWAQTSLLAMAVAPEAIPMPYEGGDDDAA